MEHTNNTLLIDHFNRCEKDFFIIFFMLNSTAIGLLLDPLQVVKGMVLSNDLCQFGEATNVERPGQVLNDQEFYKGRTQNRDKRVKKW